uniref:early nodulin-75-like n=1 Tax=Erigeron canadensis TaxID=72917 RepID=UPI001CB92AC4|nr:early nodulin-75-like [Erigeron canadensis]
MATIYSRMKKMFKKKKKPKQEPPKQEPPPRPQKIYAYKLVLDNRDSGRKNTNECTSCERCSKTQHKPEPYTKPPYNEHLCRDKSRQCTTHYNKPLFKPPTAPTPQFPPLLPSPLVAPPQMFLPPYHQQQMYALPPPRQSYPYDHEYGMQHVYPPRLGYGDSW